MTLQFESAVIQNGEFVLGPIDLQFRPAAVTVVVGPNGGGKSTLLRAAAGLLPAHKGRAFLHDTQQRKDARAQSVNEPSATAICTDQELMRIAPARRATLLSYVPQRPESVAGFSVRTSVELGRVSMRANAPQVQLAMERTGIAALADELVGHLSEGQRHRVAFARALAQRRPRRGGVLIATP